MLDLLNRYSVLLIFPAAALGLFLGAYFYFYRGYYEAPPPAEATTRSFASPVSSYTNPENIGPVRQGALLVDVGHSNGFSRPELSTFMAAITRRGYTLDFLTGTSAGAFGSPSNKSGKSGDKNGLAEKLRSSDSFLVVQPNQPFTDAEASLVRQFVVDKGGKLLLIADPTRKHNINSLSEKFGITFRPDYLYNQVDYDLNYQNIFISDFKADELTDGLGRIALYTAGSLESAGGELAVADGNTRSTIVERVERLYPMVRSEQGGVVALGDLTFLIPPQSTILHNPRLISNLADFLTTSERRFDLADFPHFFDETTQIVVGSPSLLDSGIEMARVLSEFQISSEIRNVEDPNRDLVYLGLYDDASSVAQYLQLTGVEIGAEVRTPFTPGIPREGSAVAVLYQQDQRRVLVVLGDTAGDAAGVVARLADGEFKDGIVGDSVGVY